MKKMVTVKNKAGNSARNCFTLCIALPELEPRTVKDTEPPPKLGGGAKPAQHCDGTSDLEEDTTDG